MKITGARAEAFSAIRRRALTAAGAQATGQTSAAPDSVGFLGLSEAELTPSVQAALQTLLGEIEDLRSEVGKLKGQLVEMEGLADRDVLTPVLNRRAFMRELGRIATFAARYGAPASLVYLDLDGFKTVNDRFGHAAGDAALRAVAERLAANVRDSDIVGRLGGDEFAVILVQADLEAANAKAASLVKIIEREPVMCGDWSVPLHVSVGVRQITPGADPETALAEADATMYVRKRAAEAG
jgi:diguanylate cyclase (GGDEF)-like protein